MAGAVLRRAKFQIINEEEGGGIKVGKGQKKRRIKKLKMLFLKALCLCNKFLDDTEYVFVVTN